MRLRGAAVLFWLLPKEDGKRDLRALPLKIPFKGRVRRSAHSLPLKIPTFWVKPPASPYIPLPRREGMGRVLPVTEIFIASRPQPTPPESKTQNKRGFLRGESDFAIAKSSP